MSRVRYGRWGAGLGDDDFAKALAAAGLLGAHRADADPGERGFSDLVESLRVRLDGRDGFEALPWLDPLANAGWPRGVPGAGEVWANVWDLLDPPWPVRLAMTAPGRGADPSWLTAVLAGDPVRAFPFVALDDTGAATTAWRFPLRIGFLDRPQDRRIRDEMVANLPDSSWRSALIAPVLVGRERVACEVLVLTDAVEAAVDVVAALREVRPGAVLVTRGPGRWDERLVRTVARLTGAWAVGICEAPDPADMVVRLTEHLSHNFMLDMAFTAATTGHRVLAGDARVLSRERVSLRAAAVAEMLRHAGPLPAPRLAVHTGLLAGRFRDIAANAAFVSEAGDASDLAILEREAAPVIDDASAGRRLQVRISAEADPTAPLYRLRAATTHHVAVRIGHPQVDWLSSDQPFPEDQLPTSGPHLLTVVLTEPHLLDRPLVRELSLPSVGSSSVAGFTLTTRPETVLVDARIIVLYRNRVLQTARLPSDVDAPAAARTVAASTDVAESETVVAPLDGSVGERRSFDAAFVVNRNQDGVTRVTGIGGDEADIVGLDDNTVIEALDKISRRLNEIVESPEDFDGIGDPGSVELLVFLANHGRLMRQALVQDSPGLAAVLERSRYLQVVSAKPDAFFPFELAYDLVAPAQDATLCPAAATALGSEDVDTGCPGEHTRDVVCPFGFWGLSKVIERHAYQPANHMTGAFAIRSRPSRDRDRIPLGSSVLAASRRVDQFLQGSIEQVATAAATASGKSRLVELWEDWASAVASDGPALLMLLPHTVYSDVLELYGLEIGESAQRWASQIADEDGFLPPDGRPVIVALLGCETAQAGKVGYERFPGLLRRAGAEIVIATLTEVLGRHAAPLAARLVAELYRLCGDRPQGMGEVMVRLRRRLLAEGVLAVLAVATFGDADWLVTREA